MNQTGTRLRAWFLVTLLGVGTAGGIFLAFLGMRYGGPDDVWLRVRAEIAARRPHPEFVPTPLPVSAAVAVGWKIEDAEGPNKTATLLANQAVLGELASVDSTLSTPAPPIQSPQSELFPYQQATLLNSIHQPAAQSVELTGFSHMWQTWNNCGPATLAMNLSYFGRRLNQAEVAGVLKPNRDDKNVNPEEMADFARAQGLNVLVRVNGDFDRLRLLLSNGVPVLIESWLEPEPGDGMGHYRLLTGYDDATRRWTIFDSYVSVGVDPNQPYRGINVSWDEIEPLWTVFNRTYILIYTDEQGPLVMSILGEDVDDAVMWQRALRQARSDVETWPDDPFAWFNLGTDLAALGQFEEAAAAYDRARVIGLPWRMLWYQFGPFRAYYRTGRYQELIALADATIRTSSGDVEELYYWRGLGLAAQGDTAGARKAWQQAVKLNSNYAEAAAALAALDRPGPEGTQPEATPEDAEG